MQDSTTLSVRGDTLPLPLTIAVSRLDDQTCMVTAHGQIDRTRWGVSGNMVGMMPTTNNLAAHAVFPKSWLQPG